MSATNRLSDLRWRILLLVGLAAAVTLAGIGLSRGTGGIDGLRRSDRFWQILNIRAVSAEHYDSVEAMARAADVVVVGQMESVRVGRTIGVSYPITLAEITILVHQSLVGSKEGERLTLEVVLPRPDLVNELEAALPAERGLFFLRHKFELVRNEDMSDALKARERGLYALVNDGQAVVRDIDGRARVRPGFDQDDPLRQAVDGQAFESIVGVATEAAAG